jgi:hypothetical protein
MVQDLLEQTPEHLIFVNSDGSPCTARSGERQRAGVLMAFEHDDAQRLRQFASVQAAALVEKRQLFGAATLFSEAAE